MTSESNILNTILKLPRDSAIQECMNHEAEANCSDWLGYRLLLLEEKIRNELPLNIYLECDRFLDPTPVDKVLKELERLAGNDFDPLNLTPEQFYALLNTKLKNPFRRNTSWFDHQKVPVLIPGVCVEDIDNRSLHSLLWKEINRLMNIPASLSRSQSSKTSAMEMYQSFVDAPVKLFSSVLGIPIKIKTNALEKQEDPQQKRFPDGCFSIGSTPIYREEFRWNFESGEFESAVEQLTSSSAKEQRFTILTAIIVHQQLQFFSHKKGPVGPAENKKIIETNEMMEVDDKIHVDKVMSADKKIDFPLKTNVGSVLFPIAAAGADPIHFDYLKSEYQYLQVLRCIINWLYYIRICVLPDLQNYVIESAYPGWSSKKTIIQLIRVARESVLKMVTEIETEPLYDLDAIKTCYDAIRESGNSQLISVLQPATIGRHQDSSLLKGSSFEALNVQGARYVTVEMEVLEFPGWPRNAEEFFLAAIAVVECLVVLHAANICHCDVRWHNVRCNRDASGKAIKFVLLDFEHCHQNGAGGFYLLSWPESYWESKKCDEQLDLRMTCNMLENALELLPIGVVFCLELDYVASDVDFQSFRSGLRKNKTLIKKLYGARSANDMLQVLRDARDQLASLMVQNVE